MFVETPVAWSRQLLLPLVRPPLRPPHPLFAFLSASLPYILAIMSGWRSHHRFPGNSRAPTFQPPSFYAAAAGISYQSSAAVTSPSQAPPSTYQTAPHADDSDSAKEHASSSRRRRSVSLSRALLPGGNRQEKDKAKHQNDRSQMAEIPFLETSLLPSLRDTIDKMTHPPRKEVQDGMSYPSEHAEHYVPTPSTFHKVKGSLLNTDLYRENGRSPVLSPGYSSAASPLASGSSKANSGLRTPQVTTPRSGYSTPKPPSSRGDVGSPALGNSAVASSSKRSALKSSHRTPQSSSPIPPQASTSPLPVKSLRSTKNMVTSSPATLTPTTPSACTFHRPSSQAHTNPPLRLVDFRHQTPNPHLDPSATRRRSDRTE